MKKIIAIFVSMLLISLLFTSNVLARHSGHGRGLEIGLILLGTSLLLNQHQRCDPGFEPRPWTRENRSISRSGHWETFCHEPVFDRVWNPGHYDSWGDWTPGRWQRIKVRSGYCEKIWVK